MIERPLGSGSESEGITGNDRSDERFAVVLEAAKRGEEWAWESLFGRYAGPVTGYLTARGAPDPEDTAAETLLQVARGIEGFEGDEGSFRSWLFVIAHRRMIDARRAVGRRPKARTLRADEDHPATDDPERQAIDSMMTTEMTEALEALTDTQREVLLLRIVADLSLDDVAKILGKRVGAIKALQRRGLSSLRAHLEARSVSQ